jgi:hypothetical protein
MIDNGIINALLLAKAGDTALPNMKQLALAITNDYGLEITSGGVTIEKKGKGFNLPAGVSPAQVKTVLSNLKAALSATTSKYDMEKVRSLLKGKDISLEDLSKFEGKTGDELIQAVLLAEGIDIYECLSPATKDGIEKELQEVEASVNKCRSEAKGDLRGKLQACSTLCDTLRQKLIALGGIRILDHYSRLEDILIYTGETKQTEEEKERRIGAAKKEIEKAADIADLRKVYDQYKDEIEKDEPLKTLVGQQLLTIIKENATVADPRMIPDYLAATLNLPPTQKLVSFEQGGKKYVILAELDGPGKWTIAPAKGLPTGLSVESTGDKLTVRQAGNPAKLETAEIDASGRAKQPVLAATVRYPEGTNENARILLGKQNGIVRRSVELIIKRNRKIAGNLELMKQAIDAVSDGKLDEGEAKKLAVDGKEGALFKAADNHMRTGISGGNGYLDLAELEEEDKVIADYAKKAGISEDDATTLYENSYLVDMDFEGISNKIDSLTKTVGIGLNGLDEKGLDERLKDLKLSMAPELYTLLISQIKHNVIKDARDVGIFLFGSAMASMTGAYQTFHVQGLEALVKDGKISKFSPKRPETSSDDFAYWVKEGKVKENESVAEAGGDERKKAEEIEKHIKNGDLEQALSVAKDMKLNRDEYLAKVADAAIHAKNDKMEIAEKAIKEMSAGQNKNNLTHQLIEKRINSGNFREALTLAKELDLDPESKNKEIGRIAYETYQKRVTEDDAKVVREALDAIVGDPSKISIPWENGTAAISRIIQIIEKDIWKDARIFGIETNCIKQAEQGRTKPGEAIVLTVQEPAALKAIGDLDKIITDAKSTPQQKAYGLQVKGEILYLLAGKKALVTANGKDVTGKALYYEAMFAFRQAWESAGSITDTQRATEIRKAIFAQMVNTTDYVKHTSIDWGKDDKNKAIDKNKFASELADFIPNYGGGEMTAGAYDSRMGSKDIDPSKYRGNKGMRAKAGYYKGYKSVLSATETPTAPAVATKTHNKGGTAAKPKGEKPASGPHASIAEKARAAAKTKWYRKSKGK